MNITLYGVRGSLATPGPSTARYGGNTSCVGLTGPDGSVVVLDAGTGIRPLALELPKGLTRVDVLLTHVHMDHILGLGFFGPLYDPGWRCTSGGRPAPRSAWRADSGATSPRRCSP